MSDSDFDKKNAVEQWVDEHRQLILFIFIIPLGYITSVIGKIIYRLTRPRAKNHVKRIERIRRDVMQYAEDSSAVKPGEIKLLRTDRKSARSLNVRMSNKSGSEKIVLHDLRSIIWIDPKAMRIRVEPSATIGEVVSYLDRRGFQLEAAIEMKGATLAGLVLAIGMTTNSHIKGLMYDIVEAFEIVDARGNLIRATAEGEHSELFRALPWSHGTLGFLVALELRIEPAPKYVKLTYRPFHNMDDYIDEHTRLLSCKNPPDYLEGQIFAKNEAVIIEGYKTDEKPSKNIRRNNVAKWNKPFFFKHVESMLNLPSGESMSELVPNKSFIMRHDRSMCMTMGKILPAANNPVYRKIFGWMMPPNMVFLKGSRPREERERGMKRQVYQDIGFPVEHLRAMLLHLDEELEIYPLLVYPCKVIDRGGMLRLPGYHGKEWDGKERSAFYINLGIYGEPKAIRNGNLDYPTVQKVREVEEMVRSWGGFLHTYVDVFSTEKEFETMFDHNLWKEMRIKYNAEGAFPRIYDKVKPEIDPLQFCDSDTI